MGGISSKEAALEFESDENKKIVARQDSQFDVMKHKLDSVEPLIKENIRETIAYEEDTLLIPYSQFQDTKEMERNIRKIFANFPVLDFIMDTATKMINTVSKAEYLTDLRRWDECKVINHTENRAYGVELHYKLKVLDEDPGRSGTSKKEPVVMIAYKCQGHVLDYNPADYAKVTEDAKKKLQAILDSNCKTDD
jgi:hypothetical protein